MQADLSNSRLTFIEVVGRTKSKKTIGLYSCSCGNQKQIIIQNVSNGKSKSCGCIRNELNKGKNKTHGLAKTPIYDTWHGMKRRCYETTHKNYSQYGGRGIVVCDEWLDVSVFSEWAFSNGYKKGLQIDRIDNNGNYEPSNCRFVTSRANNNNRRDNRMISFEGKTQTLQQWADEKGVKPEKIRMRIDKLKWSIERALIQ
jgi:hypothetical protein